MRILIFLSGLGTGGAERQVSLLAAGLSAGGDSVAVATILPGGRFADELAASNTPVALPVLFPDSPASQVHFSHLVRAPGRLRKLVRRFRPDIVYSWLEVGNLIAAASLPRSVPLVWGIRGEVKRDLSWKMRLIYAGLGLMSHRPSAVISNSHRGLTDAVQKWPRLPKRQKVIGNGVEVPEGTSRLEERARLRAIWGIEPDTFVIGHIARAVPEKGHRILIEAVASIETTDPRPALVCVTSGNEEAITEIRRLGEGRLSRRFTCISDGLAGVDALAGFDAFCVSSLWGEGFSNVLAEAMAAGLPCVATDCGDNALVLGGHGPIVSADTRDLSTALEHLAKSNFEDAARRSQRRRVSDLFSPSQMISESRDYLSEVVAAKKLR